MDRGDDARISAAAAQVPLHGLRDLIVIRVWIFPEQRNAGDDHAEARRRVLSRAPSRRSRDRAGSADELRSLLSAAIADSDRLLLSRTRPDQVPDDDNARRDTDARLQRSFRLERRNRRDQLKPRYFATNPPKGRTISATHFW